MSISNGPLIVVGLIAAIIAVGSIAARSGRWLQVPLPRVQGFVSCAWGAIGIIVVTLPHLRQVVPKAFSMESPLDTAGQIAALILLFYAGLRAPKHGDQQLGRTGLWVGLATAGLTLVLGLVIGARLGYSWQQSSLLTAIAMAPSLAIAGAIDESSRENWTAILAAKRFNQILAGLIFGILLLLTTFDANPSPLGEARTGVLPAILLVKTALFFAFAWFLGSRYARQFAQNPKRELTIRLLVGFILMLILLYVYASQFLGQLAALAWAYLAGVLFVKTEFRETLIPGLRRLAHLICLPLLFFSAGLKVQLGIWSVGLVLIVVVATLGRVGGASLGAKCGGLTAHEPLAAGLMTIPQAEVGVILTSYALGRGFIGGGEFSVLILAAIGTTLLGSLLAGRLKSPLALPPGGGERSTRAERRGLRGMFLRQLILAACVLVLVTSASKASDSAVESNPRDGRPVNKAGVSSLSPEEFMQAVRRDLDSAVQNHEALADSLRSESPESDSPVSNLEPALFQTSRVEAQAGWETLSSTSNAQVQAWESYFSGSGSARIQGSLLRLGAHRELLEDVLKQRGLPPELIAIAFVESEFVPNAVSSKGATGLWQFMPATALRYGLELKPFQDDRTTFEKSTAAAARYLSDLHGTFGDWLLALAAYNAGENMVAEAIVRGKSRDFWRLSRMGLLPSETQDYVPKILGTLQAWRKIAWGTTSLDPRKQKEPGSSERKAWVYALSTGN